jgi:hypothetical protein
MLEGERDTFANGAQFFVFIDQTLVDLTWAQFYLTRPQTSALHNKNLCWLHFKARSLAFAFHLNATRGRILKSSSIYYGHPISCVYDY